MPGFKPMVKMETTEPSVMLKLKKGGSATHKRLMKEGSSDGFKPMKKQTGGAIDAMAREPMPTTPMGDPAAARAMATRRMAARRPTPMPRGTPSIGRPKGPPMMPPMPPMAAAPAPMAAPTMMKKGGKMKVEQKLKKHASMPASKAHKGLKTGGIAKSPRPGEYKTGGVVDGQGGYKGGGMVTDTDKAMMSSRRPGSGQVSDTEKAMAKGHKAGGIIKTTAKKTTKMDTAHVNHNSAPTGDVKLGNAGGYKMGGSAKKHFATGGVVDSGRPVAMPQGQKPPSSPVSTNRLSGTFKTGGRVKGKKDESC